MGRLAELAGAKALTGKVTITDAKGNTRTFDNEVVADVALGGADVFHYRGSFWEVGCEPKGWPAEKARREKAAAGTKATEEEAEVKAKADAPPPSDPVVQDPEPKAPKVGKKKTKKKTS